MKGRSRESIPFSHLLEILLEGFFREMLSEASRVQLLLFQLEDLRDVGEQPLPQGLGEGVPMRRELAYDLSIWTMQMK